MRISTLTRDVVKDLRALEELAQDHVNIRGRLLLLKHLEVASEDAEHGTRDTFLHEVVVRLPVQVVFNCSKELVDLRGHVAFLLGQLLADQAWLLLAI